MQRTLSMKHPSRYDIPTIQHIKKFISSLNKAQKKAEKDGLDVDEVVGVGAP